MPPLKYYAVAKGRKTGIYDNWAAAGEAVNGYRSAVHKAFKVRKQAEDWLREQMSLPPDRDTAKKPARAPAAPPRIPLTPEQQKILDLILCGENVFFTGPAGSGKSLILEHVRYHLDQKKTGYAVTSPTGIAAVLVGGQTIHSFSGVGFGERGLREYIGMMRSKNGAVWSKKKDWDAIDVLIIDEISMLHPDLWDKLNGIGKAARNGTSFFGGLQVVVCGDFFQLPPVEKGNRNCAMCGSKVVPQYQRSFLPKDAEELATPNYQTLHSMGVDPARWSRCTRSTCQHLWNDTVRYVFQTASWREGEFYTCILETVHRQKDQEWVDILGQVKLGRPTSRVLDYLMRLQRPLPNLNGIIPTRLYTHRARVEETNEMEFNRLHAKEHAFDAQDTGTMYSRPMAPEQLINQAYFKNLQAPKRLRLKIGAQVMLVYNVSQAEGLVNGSRGVVKSFKEFERDAFLARAKTQRGQESIIVKAYNSFFDANQNPDTKTVPIPCVGFAKLDCGPSSSAPGAQAEAECNEEPVLPVLWNFESRIGESAAMVLERLQIPLTLAWAATIHKAQGVSLSYAAVDIENSFVPGQAYVGLSRCRTPQGLQILGVRGREGLRKACQADATVVAFYERLKSQVKMAPIGVEDGSMIKGEDDKDKEVTGGRSLATGRGNANRNQVGDDDLWENTTGKRKHGDMEKEIDVIDLLDSDEEYDLQDYDLLSYDSLGDLDGCLEKKQRM